MCVCPLIKPGVMTLPAALTRLPRRVTDSRSQRVGQSRRSVHLRYSNAAIANDAARLVHGHDRATENEQIDRLSALPSSLGGGI